MFYIVSEFQRALKLVFKKCLECVGLLQIVSDCFISVSIVFGCFIFSLSLFNIVMTFFEVVFG